MPWSSHIQSKHLDPVWSPLALAADALKGPVGFRSCHWLPSGNSEMGMEITWNDIFKHLNKNGYNQYGQFPSISINFPWPGLFGAVDGGLYCYFQLQLFPRAEQHGLNSCSSSAAHGVLWYTASDMQRRDWDIEVFLVIQKSKNIPTFTRVWQNIRGVFAKVCKVAEFGKT